MGCCIVFSGTQETWVLSLGWLLTSWQNVEESFCFTVSHPIGDIYLDYKPTKSGTIAISVLGSKVCISGENQRDYYSSNNTNNNNDTWHCIISKQNLAKH